MHLQSYFYSSIILNFDKLFFHSLYYSLYYFWLGNKLKNKHYWSRQMLYLFQAAFWRTKSLKHLCRKPGITNSSQIHLSLWIMMRKNWHTSFSNLVILWKWNTSLSNMMPMCNLFWWVNIGFSIWWWLLDAIVQAVI
jgi:hypothetical protein